MICSQCNGTGMAQLPHVPGNSGGWLDEKYIFSGVECGACNGSGYIQDTESPGTTIDISRMPGLFMDTTRPPSAEEQFAEHSDGLVSALRVSNFLPTRVTQLWIRKVNKINLNQPLKGLMILDELFAGYWRAAEEYKPHRDIFDLAIVKSMEFDSEMHDIKRELDWLEVVLKHMEAFMKQDRLSKPE